MILHSPEQLAIHAIAQRKKLGLTQSEVAERVGLKQKTISAFENRPESIMLSTAFLILSSLNLELEVSSKKLSQQKSQSWDQAW